MAREVTLSCHQGGPPPGDGPGGYSSDSYFIAFLGTPGGEEPWQLLFGGHHLALLKTCRGTAEIGDTTAFTGVEPKVWTDGDRIYGPLEDDRSAMVAMDAVEKLAPRLARAHLGRLGPLSVLLSG